MSTVAKTLEKLETQKQEIIAGNTKFGPGEPAAFTHGCSVGDTIPQGDLYLKIIEEVPAGYELQEKPECQLVPGRSQGARHILESVQGVEVFYPSEFSLDNLEELRGPVLRVTEGNSAKVTHPVHGDVTLVDGFTYQCVYQVEGRLEQRRVMD